MKWNGGGIYVFWHSLSGKKLYASTVSQVRDQPMPGEDEPLHAYVEVNTAINTAENCWNFLNLDIAIFRVTSQSKCRKQLQRSRRSFNKGLMWVLELRRKILTKWLINWCEIAHTMLHVHCNIFSCLQLPEGSNQLRQMQLRELAMLNGTLREDGIVSVHFYSNVFLQMRYF